MTYDEPQRFARALLLSGAISAALWAGIFVIADRALGADFWQAAPAVQNVPVIHLPVLPLPTDTAPAGA